MDENYPGNESDSGDEITITRIGQIHKGIDGRDEYFLLSNKADDLTPAQARDYLLPRVFRTTNQAGGYFCNIVLAVQAEFSTREVICTVQHRYDI